MERGDKVIVKAYKGEPLVRVVWEENNGGLLLCREEEFKEAEHDKRDAIGSGFPECDVFPYKESWYKELRNTYMSGDTSELFRVWENTGRE